MGDSLKRTMVIFCLFSMIVVAGCVTTSPTILPLSPDFHELKENENVVVLPDSSKPSLFRSYGILNLNGRGKINYSDIAYKKAIIVGEYKEKERSLSRIALRIEETGQIIAVRTDTQLNYRPQYVGFQHEMERARKLIGKNIWVKNWKYLRVSEKKDDYFWIKNLEKLTLINTKWSYKYDHPIRFIFKTESGKIGYWDGNILQNVKDIKNVGLWGTFNLYEKWHLENPRKKHTDWITKVWKAIEEREVFIGMTEDMVLLSWGAPKDKNRSIGSWGMHEQWVYSSSYLYFEDGILRSIQN